MDCLEIGALLERIYDSIFVAMGYGVIMDLKSFQVRSFVTPTG